MDASFNAGALDAACFHAQQAVEKYLKAFLSHVGTPYRFSHNLVRLVEQCAAVDPQFRTLADIVAALTPYAVELRYDDQFWPSAEATEAARSATMTVRDFVLCRLPSESRADAP